MRSMHARDPLAHRPGSENIESEHIVIVTSNRYTRDEIQNLLTQILAHINNILSASTKMMSAVYKHVQCTPN